MGTRSEINGPIFRGSPFIPESIRRRRYRRRRPRCRLVVRTFSLGRQQPQRHFLSSLSRALVQTVTIRKSTIPKTNLVEMRAEYVMSSKGPLALDPVSGSY